MSRFEGADRGNRRCRGFGLRVSLLCLGVVGKDVSVVVVGCVTGEWEEVRLVRVCRLSREMI